jgi:putative membrane protein insertion efficiency factor
MYSRLALVLIKAYQRFVSPWFAPKCRYVPTCSEYAHAAIEAEGVLRGAYKGMKRIFRCAPWGGSGFDPYLGKRL